jgi:hypothetical protein
MFVEVEKFKSRDVRANEIIARSATAIGKKHNDSRARAPVLNSRNPTTFS